MGVGRGVRGGGWRGGGDCGWRIVRGWWGGDGMGWDGMGWDGMGWDGMGWDGMGWDGKNGVAEPPHNSKYEPALIHTPTCPCTRMVESPQVSEHRYGRTPTTQSYRWHGLASVVLKIHIQLSQSQHPSIQDQFPRMHTCMQDTTRHAMSHDMRTHLTSHQTHQPTHSFYLHRASERASKQASKTSSTHAAFRLFGLETQIKRDMK